MNMNAVYHVLLGLAGGAGLWLLLFVLPTWAMRQHDRRERERNQKWYDGLPAYNSLTNIVTHRPCPVCGDKYSTPVTSADYKHGHICARRTCKNCDYYWWEQCADDKVKNEETHQ